MAISDYGDSVSFPMWIGQAVNDPAEVRDPHTDSCGWCEVVEFYEENDKTIIDPSCDEHGYLIALEPK